MTRQRGSFVSGTIVGATILFLLLSAAGAAVSETFVSVGKEKVFDLTTGIGSFSLEERVQAIEARLKQLTKSRDFRESLLVVTEFENSSNVSYQKRIIVSIADKDAVNKGKSRSLLAKEVRDKLSTAIIKERESSSYKKIGLSVAYTFFSTLLLFGLLAFLSKFFPSFSSVVRNWSGSKIPSLKIGTYEVLPASRLVGLIVWSIKVLRVVLTLVLVYFYIPLVLSFFPATSTWAGKIYGYIANPINQISKVVVNYIPNMFFIAVIVILANYLLRFIKFIFTEIEGGAISLSGFHKDWAIPTYKLVRFLILAFTLIVIFPYLPGAESPAFKGVSLFMGVLFSLGSSSAIANVVSGVVLTYMRPFKLRDRVKISDTMGAVIEKTLLVTRVRTTKNVDVTIPNAMVLGSHIINYSSSVQETGLILHTTVTIGYDVDWREVHKLLIASASEVPSIQNNPAPFVLQKSLDDFYVSYELNAYTNEPGKMSETYSRIHQRIQDSFANSKIEILSPHYAAIRDGSQITCPSGDGTNYVGPIRVSTNQV